MTGEVKLTKAQRRALEVLDRAGFRGLRTGMFGQELSDKPHLKAQGAGRIGGSMGKRLQGMGLASPASIHHGGWPAWAITPAGRLALESSQ